MRIIKSYTIDEEIVQELDKEAKEQGRSVSNLLNMILKIHFKLVEQIRK
jgi:hypothetical protein